MFLRQPGLKAGLGARKEGASVDKSSCSRRIKKGKLEVRGTGRTVSEGRGRGKGRRDMTKGCIRYCRGRVR